MRDPDDHAEFLAYLDRHGALTPELRAKYARRPPQQSPSGDLAPADLAALNALAASQVETHRALQELTRSIALAIGVQPAQSQPDQPRPKRSYRFARMERGENGELSGDVEYADGRVRHFCLGRTATGDLEGDIEDADAAPAPAADAAPAPSAAPEPKGVFADAFGSIEEPRP